MAFRFETQDLHSRASTRFDSTLGFPGEGPWPQQIKRPHSEFNITVLSEETAITYWKTPGGKQRVPIGYEIQMDMVAKKGRGTWTFRGSIALMPSGLLKCSGMLTSHNRMEVAMCPKDHDGTCETWQGTFEPCTVK